MIERFVSQGSFIYFRLTDHEEEIFLIHGPRTYLTPILGGHRRISCQGVELDHEAAIDLLVAAENVADTSGVPVHLQTREGYTVDVIYPPKGQALQIAA